MPRYTVNAIPGRGNGLVANQVIDPGTKIIVEEPLIEIDIGVAWSALDSFNFFTQQQNVLDNAVNGLTPAKRGYFRALSHDSNNNTNISSLQRNSFSEESEVDVPGTTDKDTTLRVYRYISLINHSCIPNAMYVWELPRARGVIRAVKRIETGQEIFLAYHLADWWDGTSRRASLNTEYDFVCTCPACPVPARVYRNQDARRWCTASRVRRTHMGTLLTRHHPKNATESQATVMRWITASERCEPHVLMGEAECYLLDMEKEGIRDQRYVEA
ncbi:SET domain-containing protein [Tothia fuscella]|uniref:SET domain-containing protein n=1 Tax=Tothia fuscella TaxID=1048955 RepID=A0A9P4U160_9PEZI|nr:SET domain-containing protein [Tothia fuscella]